MSTAVKSNIPTSMVMNLDQTPTKYVPEKNKTMALKVQNQYLYVDKQINKQIVYPSLSSLTGGFYLHK